MFKSFQSHGTPVQQARQAVEVKYDCTVTSIEEIELGPSFLPGTTCFCVYRQDATCTHDPPCTWYVHAYNHKRITVVLAQADMQRVSVAALQTLLEY